MREDFKARMRRIRLREGFASQRLAADAIGCPRGTVGMWEAPSSAVQSVSDWLFDVARVYKVRPEWINNLSSDDDGYPWEPADGQGVTIHAHQIRDVNLGYGRELAEHSDILEALSSNPEAAALVRTVLGLPEHKQRSLAELISGEEHSRKAS